MPYIPEHRRERLRLGDAPASPGELNYAITKLCDTYAATRFGYSGINDVLGALEGAKLEFYRRVAAPYEDTKREQNGDVYDASMTA